MRLILLAIVGSPNPFIGDDQQDYLGLSDQLVATGSYRDPRTLELTAYRDPGYPSFLAVLSLVGVEATQTIVVVQIMLSALTGALLVRVAGLVSGSNAARGAGMLFLLHAAFATYPLFIYPETLFCALLGLILLALQWWMRSGNIAAQSVVGVLVAVALLTRFAASLGIALLVGSTILSRPRLRTSTWWLILLIPALTVFGWSWRNYHAVGSFAPNTSGAVNVYLGNNSLDESSRPGGGSEDLGVWDPLEALSEGKRPARSIQLAFGFFRDHPAMAFKQVLTKVPESLEFDRMFIGLSRRGEFPARTERLLLTVGALVALMSLVPYAMCLSAAFRPESDWLWRGAILFGLGILAVEIMTVAHSRYSMPGWMALIPSAGMYLSRFDWTDSRYQRSAMLAASILLLVWLRQFMAG